MGSKLITFFCCAISEPPFGIVQSFFRGTNKKFFGFWAFFFWAVKNSHVKMRLKLKHRHLTVLFMCQSTKQFRGTIAGHEEKKRVTDDSWFVIQ